MSEDNYTPGDIVYEHLCPSCQGRRGSEVFANTVNGCQMRWMDCGNCKGDGAITHADLLRYIHMCRKFHERREERMATGMTVTETARHLGVDVREYIEYAMGRTDEMPGRTI